MVILYNKNPKRKNADDCVVRSIAEAEGKSWLEVFDALTTIGRKLYRMPNESEVFHEYLKHYPTLPVFYKNDLDQHRKMKRLKVKEVPKNGTYIIRVHEHLTLVRNGNLIDTWDCGDLFAYKIWKVG